MAALEQKMVLTHSKQLANNNQLGKESLTYV